MIDWAPTAARLGYESELAMWTDLYIDRGLSISTLATKLDVSRNTVRTSLERLNIAIRKQGGPNNQKLNITDELVDEIKREGIAAVAKRLNLSYTTVYKRLYRVRGLKVSDLHPKDADRVATIDPTEPEIDVEEADEGV